MRDGETGFFPENPVSNVGMRTAKRDEIEPVERYDLRPGFQTPGMDRTVTRPEISLSPDLWFGVTSFELG